MFRKFPNFSKKNSKEPDENTDAQSEDPASKPFEYKFEKPPLFFRKTIQGYINEFLLKEDDSIEVIPGKSIILNKSEVLTGFKFICNYLNIDYGTLMQEKVFVDSKGKILTYAFSIPNFTFDPNSENEESLNNYELVFMAPHKRVDSSYSMIDLDYPTIFFKHKTGEIDSGARYVGGKWIKLWK